MQKEALSGFGDKRYVIPLNPLHKTMAWFHKDLPESAREHCDQNGPIKVVNTPFTLG